MLATSSHLDLKLEAANRNWTPKESTWAYFDTTLETYLEKLKFNAGPGQDYPWQNRVYDYPNSDSSITSEQNKGFQAKLWNEYGADLSRPQTLRKKVIDIWD